MTSVGTPIVHFLSGINWGPVSGWMTLAAVLVAIKGLRLNERQHKETEVKPARLVTLIGEAHHRSFSGRLHVLLTVTNDAEGPIVDPRPLVFLQDAGGGRTSVSYGLCGSEQHAEHRIVGGRSQMLSLFFPDSPELTKDSPLAFGLEFTDMAGLRWRRIGTTQPVRLVGDEAEVKALDIDSDHARRERDSACAGTPVVPGQ